MAQQIREFGHKSIPDHKGSGSPQRGGQNTIQQLPVPKPLTYFSDPEKKCLKPDLLDDQARKNAEEFKDLKATQMRRFYDELKAIERKIMTGKDIKEQQANFERDRAMIIMFKAKSVYAEKRKVAPRAFTQFIFDHVASITDINDFKGFLKVFEAVVAFHKFFSLEK
jgi:CRISPR-associated protein Csm2